MAYTAPELRIVQLPPHWAGRNVLLAGPTPGNQVAGLVLRAQDHEVLVQVQGKALPFQQHDLGVWSCSML